MKWWTAYYECWGISSFDKTMVSYTDEIMKEKIAQSNKSKKTTRCDHYFIIHHLQPQPSSILYHGLNQGFSNCGMRTRTRKVVRWYTIKFIKMVQGAKKWKYDPFYLSFGFMYVWKSVEFCTTVYYMLWNSFWVFNETIITDGNVTKYHGQLARRHRWSACDVS